MVTFLNSPVGKKIVMAITGQIMILFVVFHVIGNSFLYVGWLNAYAERLHSFPPLLWALRIMMISVCLLHVFIGVTLTIENRPAGRWSYAVSKNLEATYAGKNMIWTGVAVGIFAVYHLLHFTVQVFNPEISATMNTDIAGRPDVLKMVVLNFQALSTSVLYIMGMLALFMHLLHGIQSSIQTLGLNNERTISFTQRFGSVAAVILFIAYIAIPIAVYFGVVRL